MRNIFGYFFTVIALISLILYIFSGGALLNWEIPMVSSEFTASFFSFFGCSTEFLQRLMPIFFVVFVVTGIIGFAFFLGLKRRKRKTDSELNN